MELEIEPPSESQVLVSVFPDSCRGVDPLGAMLSCSFSPHLRGAKRAVVLRRRFEAPAGQTICYPVLLLLLATFTHYA